MKYTILLIAVAIVIFAIPIHFSEPGFNGSSPGCDGSGCHALEDGLVSATVTDLQVAITVNGTTSSVAGELVDANGTVVDFNNSTGNNPFTLTAPDSGTYTVNAGFKNPSKKWDSVMVNISLTDVGENPSNPASFELFDNYPNPFNPSTTLRYSIPEASFTSVKIYDALGNEVSSLVNETKSAGTYEVEFNASDLSSGIYYYTLNAGSFTETKKMILIK